MRAIALVALIGCGEAATSIPDGRDVVDAAAALTVDALCRGPDGVLVRLRARLAACAPDRADGLDLASYEALCRASIEPYLADGTIALGDAAAIAACASHVDAVACAELDPVRLGPCAAILVGHQPIDGACERDAQCARGGYCASGDGCGRCAPIAADGGACDRHAGCATGRCALGVCAAPAAIGASCVDDGDCAGARRCLAGACSASTGSELDLPCEITLEACAPAATGRFCQGTDEAATTGTCRPFAARGDACAGLGTWPGAWCDWTAFDRCVDGQCAAVAPGGVGDACDPEATCDVGLVCRAVAADAAPTCAAPLLLGDACVDAEACAAPMTCLGGRCQLGPYSGACPAP